MCFEWEPELENGAHALRPSLELTWSRSSERAPRSEPESVFAQAKAPSGKFALANHGLALANLLAVWMFDNLLMTRFL